jgi:uncharacterized protein
MEWLLWYLALGAFVGFVAGLFGIGGGLTLVPMLSLLYAHQGFPPEHLMHLSLGTAMASIVFTSISSMRAHHGHGAVRWKIFGGMAPGLVLGTLAATTVAGLIATKPLAIIFTCIAYFAAAQMMMDIKPQPHRQVPGMFALFAAGALIGAVSSLVSAGGGFLSIPFMVWCNVAMHHAVGTSAALGLPIALAGTLGYIVGGWNASGLPQYSLGYVYLPGFAGVVTMSVLFAPLGAKVAHKLRVKQLKRAFGGFLALLASEMLRRLLS